MTKKEREIVAEWNSYVAHYIDLNPESFEAEDMDMYSIALGFFIAKGLEADQAHSLLCNAESKVVL